MPRLSSEADSARRLCVKAGPKGHRASPKHMDTRWMMARLLLGPTCLRAEANVLLSPTSPGSGAQQAEATAGGPGEPSVGLPPLARPEVLHGEGEVAAQ